MRLSRLSARYFFYDTHNVHVEARGEVAERFVKRNDLAVLLVLELLLAVSVQILELFDVIGSIGVVVGRVIGIGLLQLVADHLDQGDSLRDAEPEVRIVFAMLVPMLMFLLLAVFVFLFKGL